MKKIALIFPGQGPQYIGMGKGLYGTYRIFRETFQEASDLLQWDMAKMCFEGDAEELSLSINTQPALVTYGVAAYRVLKDELGIKVSYGAGHSLGELTALTCSGAIAFKDAVKIALLRGELMQEYSCSGKVMAVVGGINRLIVEEVCNRKNVGSPLVEVVCHNAPKQTVITGDRKSVEVLCDLLEKLGGQANIVNVSVQSHCRHMGEAARIFSKELSKFQFHPFHWPVVGNVDGRCYQSPQEISRKLGEHLIKPVLWEESMKYLRDERTDLIIDIGPKATMKKMTLENNPYQRVLSVDHREDFNLLLKSIEKHRGIVSIIEKALAIVASTPNYDGGKDDDKTGSHENQMLENEISKNMSYLKQILAKVHEKGNEFSSDDLQMALAYFEKILQIKKVPLEEYTLLMKEVVKMRGLQDSLEGKKNDGEELIEAI